MQKGFKKIIFTLGIFLSFTLFNSVDAAVLLPGNISTCGELAAPGTYTLTGNVNGGSNTCFTISSDNVTINGTGKTISGTGAVAIDARKRSGEGTALVEGGNGFTNLVINDVNISGYTTGINLSGNDDTTGNGINNGFAGDAGDVSIFYSIVGSVVANGGNASTKTFGGVGGNITFTDTNLNISNSTISALGGTGTSGDNTDGGLDLNYSGTLTRANLALSELSYFNDNSTEYGTYPGGTWPISPGNINSCGTLRGSGTYTLTSSVTSSSTCFIIASNSVVINGAGYSILGADASSTAFAIKAGSYSSFTLASTTVTNYSNLITSSSSVTISGHNLDLSNKYIAAGSLTLTYTGALNKVGATISSLTSLVVNGVSYGAQSAGSLLDWVVRTGAGSRAWYSITSSADGMKLAAVYPNGYIYTSSDGGETWTARTSAGSRTWSKITSSADGMKLAAIVENGYIYTSTDGGVTWTERTTSGARQWGSISMSSNGSTIVANGWSVPNYISKDGGSTWTQVGPNQTQWFYVNISADGSKIAAVHNGGYVYTSSDGGSTWTARTSSGAGSWVSVDSSSDGTKLVAARNNGYIYTSSDGGETWTARTSAGSRGWYSVVMSSDGSRIFAGATSGGQIYMSADGGATWNQKSPGSGNWTELAITPDGKNVFAVNQGGYIYTYRDSALLNNVNILTPSSGLTSYWSPAVAWSDSSSCYYSYNNFTSTSTANCSNFGSDIARPSSYGSSTLYIKGIDSNGVVSQKNVSFNLAFGPVINGPITGSSIQSASWTPSIIWDPSSAGNLTSCSYSYNNFVSTSTVNCSLGGTDILPPATTSNATTTLTIRTQDSNGNIAFASSTFGYVTWKYNGSFSFWSGAGASANTLLSYIGSNTSGAGPLMRSINGGITWLSTTAGNRPWREIAVSSDGTRVAATTQGGYIYMSTDSGVTWTAKTAAGARNWFSIAGSSDGMYLAAVVVNGYIYTSSDGGDTWIERLTSGSRAWNDIASSADGSKLAALHNTGNIYTSTDYGATWTARTSSGNRNWKSIASSADGSRLAATVGSNGFIYTSTDSGATWATSTTAGAREWNGIGMSADGTKIAASFNAGTDGQNGFVMVSNDFGATWATSSPGQARQPGGWGFSGSLNVSADFTRIVAPVFGGQVWTFYNPSSLSIDILRPFTGNTVNTWNPYISFGTAITCQYSWDNSNWNTISCSNSGSDIPAPSYGSNQTLYVKGTDIANNVVTKQSTFNYLQAATSTNISSCGTITSPGTYTLTGNITGATSSCFTILANNVTIDGAGYTVTATSSNNRYAIVATSTMVSGNAFNNLTVKNITFTGFNGGGINASGSNGGCVGGSGGSVTVSTSSMGAILTTGGNGTGLCSGSSDWQSGGHAGNVTINNATIGAITSIGGNSSGYWEGRGGYGGNIYVASSTVGGNINTTGGGASFICGHPGAGNGGSIDILRSTVSGTVTSQGGQEGNNCSSVTWNGPISGVINIATSTVTGTITGQGGRGASVDRPDLVNNQLTTVGGVPSNIYITNSVVSNVVSQGGAGGPNAQVNKNGANGGNGGNIIIASSTFGNISSLGGAGGSIYNNSTSSGAIGGRGGNSGNITITGSVLNFSGKNIYGLGGAAGGTGGTLGQVGSSSSSLILSYTTSFTDPALHSPFGQVLIYRADGQVQAGTNVASTTLLSSLPITGFATPGNISSCGNIYFSGTYTLTGNITNATSTCFTILADDVTIDGAGYTVTASLGNVGHGVNATGYDNVVIKNVTFTGFGGGVVSSNEGVTFEDDNLDISGMTITADSLVLSYTNALTAVNATLSALSSLMINDIDFGAFAGGLFNWGTYSVSACGNINNPGLYTLTQDLLDSSGQSCLKINTNLVYIDGDGHTISSNAGGEAYAIDATKSNDNAYSNISIKDLNISGYEGGVDARGAAGYNGGNVVLNNVTTGSTIVAVNTSAATSTSASGGAGGNITINNSTVGHIYANGANTNSTSTPVQGGNGGAISITNSTVASVQSSGGNSSGNLNPGSDVGTYDGGIAGTYTTFNSTVGTVTRNAGAGYIPGCTDNSFPNYNSSATYNDGSCALPEIGTGRDNPAGNTISGPITFYGFSNRGIVNGDADYYGYDVNYNNYYYDQGNYGTTTGFAYFYDNWNGGGPNNYGYVGGGATFDGYDTNNNGVVDGNANFNGDYTDNNGIVNGDVNFYGYYASNNGTVNGNVFFGYYGANSNSGVINGNADFTGGGGYQSYNYGTVNGDATFWSNDDWYGYYNYGTVTGTTTVLYGCTDPSAANYNPNALNDHGGCLYYGQNADLPNGVTYNGDLSFCGYSNYGTVNGNVTFTCGGGGNYGTITGNAIFESGTLNLGTVVGSATFHDFTGVGGVYEVDTNYYNGTGIVNGTIYDVNSEPITLFSFSNSTPNIRVLSSDAIFNDTAYNDGQIYGNVTFNTTYYSSTTPQNGIFSIEDNNWSGSIIGTVYGSDSNPITEYHFYNSTVNNGTTTADSYFHDSSRNAGTVLGNMIIDSDYYTGSVPTTSTLILNGSAEWRGTVIGDIFAADGLTEITAFNFTGASSNHTIITSSATTTFSGTASNNGTINGNAVYNGTTFRIGTVNGTATLGGLAQTIQGVNNVVNFVKQLLTPSRDTLYFTSGSTLNVSGLFTLLGYDANNLLTVRSTTPNSYATLNVNGTFNWDFLRLKDVRNTNGTINLSSKTVFNDGGNSGFTFPGNSAPGQRNNGLTGAVTAPSLPPSRGGATPSSPSTNAGGTSAQGLFRNLNNPGQINFTPIPTFTPFGASFRPQNIGTTVIPYPFKDFKAPEKLTLIQLPTNITPSVSRFLFAPLPETITSTIAKLSSVANVLSSAGVTKEQDLASLAFRPLEIKVGDEVPAGHFMVKSGDTELTSYVTYDSSVKSLAQMVKVSPSQAISISLIPLSDGEVTATYLDQTLEFSTGSEFATTYLTTPPAPGRYVIKTSSSPIPLLLEVVGEVVKEPEQASKPWGIFNFIWKLFNK